MHLCELKEISFKRYLLLLLCFTYFLFTDNNYNNYYILGSITFINSFVILLNFTYLVEINNSKPLYYEDIYIDVNKLPLIPLDAKRKKIYKQIYNGILIFSNSILITALVCYWKSKIENLSSYIEIVGITGGLIEIAACFNNLTSKIAIFFIKKFINIQISSRQNSLDDDVENINNIEFNK